MKQKSSHLLLMSLIEDADDHVSSKVVAQLSGGHPAQNDDRSLRARLFIKEKYSSNNQQWNAIEFAWPLFWIPLSRSFPALLLLRPRTLIKGFI
eukprot:gene35729-46352_t